VQLGNRVVAGLQGKSELVSPAPTALLAVENVTCPGDPVGPNRPDSLRILGERPPRTVGKSELRTVGKSELRTRVLRNLGLRGTILPREP